MKKLFETDFEDATLSINKTHLSGVTNGFSWSEIPHNIEYVTGILGTDIDASIADEAFNAAIYNRVGTPPARVQLQFTHRTDPSIYTKSQHLINLPNGLPSDNTSWIMIFEVWDDPTDQVQISLKIKRETYGRYYWTLAGTSAVDFGNMNFIWGPYVNKRIEVPLNRFFTLETFQTRKPDDTCIFKVKVDGQTLFDLANVRTTNATGKNYRILPVKLYTGNDGAANTPYYLKVKHIEIWDETPS